MIDYEKLHERIMSLSKEHGEIIEKQLQKVISEFDCKPSQIELRCYPSFQYKVYIKADEFEINHEFIADCSKFEHKAWADQQKDESVTDCHQLKCEHDFDKCQYDKDKIKVRKGVYEDECENLWCQCGEYLDMPHNCTCIKCGKTRHE